jgi:stage II sporulation protein M
MSFKLWIFIATALFSVGLVWGLTQPISSGDTLSAETKVLEDFANFINSLPAWAMFGFILLKNVSAVLFGFIMSPLFLVVPVISLVLNGSLIGMVAGTVIAEQSIGYLLAGLLPHGIFELPALFIGEAAALSSGLAVIQMVISSSKRELLTSKLKFNLKYLGISLALFIPAALIETFVTPLFLNT